MQIHSIHLIAGLLQDDKTTALTDIGSKKINDLVAKTCVKATVGISLQDKRKDPRDRDLAKAPVS